MTEATDSAPDLCGLCGVEVTWSRTGFGNSIALVPAGTYAVIDDRTNMARFVSVYEEHVCVRTVPAEGSAAADPDQLTDSGAVSLASEIVSCDKCEAKPGEKCKNLVERKRGNDRDTTWPHEERQKTAASLIRKARKEMTPDVLHDEATHWPCFSCGADRGERCKSRAISDGSAFTKHPHPFRNPRDRFLAYRDERVRCASRSGSAR